MSSASLNKIFPSFLLSFFPSRPSVAVWMLLASRESSICQYGNDHTNFQDLPLLLYKSMRDATIRVMLKLLTLNRVLLVDQAR